MAKINLLTIHYGRCYGAVMQTYATCRLLEKYGHQVTVINLVSPREKTRALKEQLRSSIQEFQFWFFKKRFFSPLSHKIYNINSLKHFPEADVTIVGSDQVWNRSVTGIFDYTYYLDFLKPDHKKVAFCSSFGTSTWNEEVEYTENVNKLLHDFEAISVREDTGVQILKHTFNLDSVQLLDPTLGYGDFSSLKMNNNPKHQIFSFLFNRSPKAIECLECISTSLHLPIYKNTRLNTYLFSGPRYWLTNIANSDFIVTDSFHGLALSIIFQKQFIVFCADERKFSRLNSLLSLLGLSSRFVKSLSDFNDRKDELLNKIDYIQVNSILCRERLKVEQFITDNL